MRVISVDASIAAVVVLDVQLEDSQTTNEICFNREVKAFLRKQHAHARSKDPQAGDLTAMTIKAESNNFQSQENSQHTEPAAAPSSSALSCQSRLLESPEHPPSNLTRFGSDLISRLEKKYCGGLESDENTAQYSDDDDSSQQPTKKRGRQPNDNYYDLDDPFIDDTDALDVIEQQRRQSKTKTKHQGFFMSAGELQVHDSEASNAGNGGTKKRRSREPDDKQTEALRVFKNAVVEVFGRKVSMDKRLRSFPKQLESHLGVLDKAFFSNTSTETQIPYLDLLVEMMPLAKNTIKSAVLRLRYQELAQTAKQSHETAKQQLQAEVLQARSTPRSAAAEPATSLARDTVEQADALSQDSGGSIAKPDVWNDLIGTLLVNTIRCHEEWLAYEVKLSKVKRPEDKRELSQDAAPEVEHARIEAELYAEIASFWPANSMDENQVRRHYKAATSASDVNQKRKRESGEAPRKKAESSSAAKGPDGKDAKRKSNPTAETSQSISTSVPQSGKRSSQNSERKSMPAKSDTIQLPTTFDQSDFIPQASSQSN